jgi:hypothetical protein
MRGSLLSLHSVSLVVENVMAVLPISGCVAGMWLALVFT